MQSLRRALPSANSLFVFEAAARHESFKSAAEELNVTQPAVTHAIRQLEGHLGLRLFHRHHRRVELTGDGKKFFKDLRSGFEIIQRSLEGLQPAPAAETVALSISTSMAATWLLPRLADFRSKHPDIEIRFQASDKDLHPAQEKVDLMVRMGDAHWPDLDAWRFIDEEIFPVCSPSYLAEAPPLTGIADLARHHLLHLQEPYRDRINWNGWLQASAAKLRISHGDVFTDSQLLYQATIEGQGVCLGWAGVLEIPLKQGLLIRPLETSVRTDKAFHIIAAKGVPLSPQARALRDWMLDQGKAHRREAASLA